MSRYIDADALLKHKTDHEMISTHLIYNAPTAEVKPVVRGEWKVCDAKPPTWWYECSVCGGAGNIEYNYCPNCGAVMKGGSNETDN